MASRRMFSFRVTESTRFLKMPATSQNLYFHLCMHADDDGVVEAYNVIRLLGATEDDLRVIVSKGFATLLNEDMVTYINDWRENNNIRADRKTDSVYQELLLSVIPDADLVESKTSYYARKKKICQTNNGQNADSCQPIDRIGKDRLGKDSIDINNNICASDNAPKADKNAINDFFERIWKLYPNKKGKGQVSDSKKKILYRIGFDELSRAIDRYKAGLAKDEWRKPQNGSTFFNSGYVDYLDRNYTEPEQPAQPERTKYNNDFSDYVQELMTGKEVLEDEPFK